MIAYSAMSLVLACPLVLYLLIALKVTPFGSITPQAYVLQGKKQQKSFRGLGHINHHPM
jgi:hypothetical protein